MCRVRRHTAVGPANGRDSFFLVMVSRMYAVHKSCSIPFLLAAPPVSWMQLRALKVIRQHDDDTNKCTCRDGCKLFCVTSALTRRCVTQVATSTGVQWRIAAARTRRCRQCLASWFACLLFCRFVCVRIPRVDVMIFNKLWTHDGCCATRGVPMVA